MYGAQLLHIYTISSERFEIVSHFHAGLLISVFRWSRFKLLFSWPSNLTPVTGILKCYYGLWLLYLNVWLPLGRHAFSLHVCERIWHLQDLIVIGIELDPSLPVTSHFIFSYENLMSFFIHFILWSHLTVTVKSLISVFNYVNEILYRF